MKNQQTAKRDDSSAFWRHVAHEYRRRGSRGVDLYRFRFAFERCTDKPIHCADLAHRMAKGGAR